MVDAFVRGLTTGFIVGAPLAIGCSAQEMAPPDDNVNTGGQRPSSTDSSADGASERVGVGGQAGGDGQPEGGGRGDSSDSSAADAPAVVPELLVFSRTTGFRHPSIVQGIAALSLLGMQRGWGVTATEDPTQFTDQGLLRFNVVVFLSTTGDVLDTVQQAAFERFIQRGNGYVGVHSASDTEYDWPWYGELVGAYFRTHPAIQSAELHVEGAHPSTLGLPATWTRTDEWYGFRDNPRSRVTVVISLDESTYAPEDSAMGDHPIAWYHEHDGGRAFYTGLGHTEASFSEPLFLDHLAGAIEWAARR
ncbi:MAG TPA: ThuA domain-containing protein [Polyangiaceae bacterium]|nr:ThuA domain-containing protein [Polyangiaceae bacterium]